MGNAIMEKRQAQENFRIQIQREGILQKLRERGYRMTKQRIAVIDIILENECGSCKEIIYHVSKVNKAIGTATIYRTINILEEIGAICRRNIYRLSDIKEISGVMIMLEGGEEIHITPEEWNEVIRLGLAACGYKNEKKVLSILQRRKNGIIYI